MTYELLTTFVLLFVAEMGDKSQLVCLALASRFRASYVVLGALVAFAVLNSVAVAAGLLLGVSVTGPAVRFAAILLFVGFGLHTLFTASEEEEQEQVQEKMGVHPVISSALLLGLAELGDKTQLTVATLSTVQSPVATWIGATLALTTTSALAAYLGSRLLPMLPRVWVARVSGGLFLLVALWLALTS